MKFLLIDDEEITNFINREVIQIYDPTIETVTFQDPHAALDQLGLTSPDCIFLDLMMPIMNGYQFLDELQIRDIHIPVIVLSSSISEHDIQKAKSYHNVLSFISKPLKPQHIEAALAEIKINLKEPG